MALQKDKHGITVLPDVARIDQYNEVAIKRFVPSAGWDRATHLLAVSHYGLQGLRIIETIKREIEKKTSEQQTIDTLLLSKLCHKAANAFLESDKACSSYKKKYGGYGLGETGK